MALDENGGVVVDIFQFQSELHGISLKKKKKKRDSQFMRVNRDQRGAVTEVDSFHHPN